MNNIAEQILTKKVVLDADGNELPLHSETSREQCEYLQEVIKAIGAERCIEIGLAYGISSLFIGEAIADKPARKLISIDPLQDSWKNIGALNMERAGYGDFFEASNTWSYETLPALLAKGETFDFAYIDTSKVFDTILIDAFYIIRMLRVGGVVIFDDCQWPGINRTLRYICQWPHMEVHSTHGPGTQRRSMSIASAIAKCIPGSQRFVNHKLSLSDDSLGINASCVALKKIAQDERSWDWHKEF